MVRVECLDRARAVYRETRHIWFAGGILDAHERLALITVAAGLRHFAFLSHLTCCWPIRDQCESAGVPFFFKQWGGINKKKAGRELEGVTHDAMPARPRPSGSELFCIL